MSLCACKCNCMVCGLAGKFSYKCRTVKFGTSINCTLAVCTCQCVAKKLKCTPCPCYVYLLHCRSEQEVTDCSPPVIDLTESDLPSDGPRVPPVASMENLGMVRMSCVVWFDVLCDMVWMSCVIWSGCLV